MVAMLEMVVYGQVKTSGDQKVSSVAAKHIYRFKMNFFRKQTSSMFQDHSVEQRRQKTSAVVRNVYQRVRLQRHLGSEDLKVWSSGPVDLLLHDVAAENPLSRLRSVSCWAA